MIKHPIRGLATGNREIIKGEREKERERERKCVCMGERKKREI